MNFRLKFNEGVSFAFPIFNQEVLGYMLKSTSHTSVTKKGTWGRIVLQNVFFIALKNFPAILCSVFWGQKMSRELLKFKFQIFIFKIKNFKKKSGGSLHM